MHQSGSSVLDDFGVESGVHGVWNWDASEFTLQTDLFGYLPYYYHHDPDTGELLVSDSPQRIASCIEDCTFDSRALGFFSRAGFILGDRTLYDGIKRVPANSSLRWVEGAVSITPNVVERSTERPRSAAEAIDGWIDRFRSAMKRRNPGDSAFSMPLSAGRDSRMMLLELHALGSIPSELVTVGSKGNDDVQIARTIADRMDLPFRNLKPTRHGWLDIERHRHAMCGYEAIEHSWLIPLWHDLSHSSSGWFDGLGCGSVIRNSVNDQFALELLKSVRVSDWSRLFFSRTPAASEHWIQRITQSSPVPISGEEDVFDLIQEELDLHRDQPNPITSFTFHNWGRRSISLNPFGICRDAPAIQVPFMDRTLVEWSLGIPAEWCFEHDIQTQACHRLYPDFSDVPFTLGARSNRNPRNRMLRLASHLQRRRFFRSEAPFFRKLYEEVTNNTRGNPGSFRAVTLMTHLALVDKTLSPS